MAMDGSDHWGAEIEEERKSGSLAEEGSVRVGGLMDYGFRSL